MKNAKIKTIILDFFLRYFCGAFLRWRYNAKKELEVLDFQLFLLSRGDKNYACFI